MRVKSVNFERGNDPKRQMGIGLPPSLQENIEEIFEKYLLKFSDIDKIEFKWQYDMPSPFGPHYADSYLIALIPCKNRETRKKIKNMVESSESHQGPDYKFWGDVFDLIDEKGQNMLNFHADRYGIPKKGIKISLVIS